MFQVTKFVELDMGHRVPFHESKCHNLHGHRYKVVATAEAPELIPPTEKDSESGMVVDFGILKKALLAEVHDPYDHRLVLWTKDPLLRQMDITLEEDLDGWPGLILVPCIPTAEELARFWFAKVDHWLRMFQFEGRYDNHLKLRSITVYETPTSTATFTPDDPLVV